MSVTKPTTKTEIVDDQPLLSAEDYNRVRKLKRIFWILLGIGIFISFVWVFNFLISMNSLMKRFDKFRILGIVLLVLFFVKDGFLLLFLGLYAGNVY